jgi:hypothetical protein
LTYQAHECERFRSKDAQEKLAIRARAMANIALEEDAGVDSEGKALGAFGAFKEGTTFILGNLCLVCLLLPLFFITFRTDKTLKRHVRITHAVDSSMSVL